MQPTQALTLMQAFAVDPSEPFAPYVNGIIATQFRLTFEQLYDQIRSSYKGDPMLGTIVPNTSIKWENTDEVQSAIFEWYRITGRVIPSNFADILTKYKAPDQVQFLSYSGWGLVPGSSPSAAIRFVEGVNPVTGAVETVMLPAGSPLS